MKNMLLTLMLLLASMGIVQATEQKAHVGAGSAGSAGAQVQALTEQAKPAAKFMNVQVQIWCLKELSDHHFEGAFQCIGNDAALDQVLYTGNTLLIEMVIQQNKNAVLWLLMSGADIYGVKEVIKTLSAWPKKVKEEWIKFIDDNHVPYEEDDEDAYRKATKDYYIAHVDQILALFDNKDVSGVEKNKLITKLQDLDDAKSVISWILINKGGLEFFNFLTFDLLVKLIDQLPSAGVAGFAGAAGKPKKEPAKSIRLETVHTGIAEEHQTTAGATKSMLNDFNQYLNSKLFTCYRSVYKEQLRTLYANDLVKAFAASEFFKARFGKLKQYAQLSAYAFLPDAQWDAYTLCVAAAMRSDVASLQFLFEHEPMLDPEMEIVRGTSLINYLKIGGLDVAWLDAYKKQQPVAEWDAFLAQTTFKGSLVDAKSQHYGPGDGKASAGSAASAGAAGEPKKAELQDKPKQRAAQAGAGAGAQKAIPDLDFAATQTDEAIKAWPQDKKDSSLRGVAVLGDLEGVKKFLRCGADPRSKGFDSKNAMQSLPAKKKDPKTDKAIAIEAVREELRKACEDLDRKEKAQKDQEAADKKRKIAAQQAAVEQRKQEAAAKKQQEDRQRQQQAQQEAEKVRKAAQKEAENRKKQLKEKQERLAREKEQAEKIAKEKEELAKQLEAERAARKQQEEQEEAERLQAAEDKRKAEQEAARVAQEKAEQEAQARELAQKAENERIEKERLALQQAQQKEAERKAQEEARLAAQKAAQQAEAERLVLQNSKQEQPKRILKRPQQQSAPGMPQGGAGLLPAMQAAMPLVQKTYVQGSVPFGFGQPLPYMQPMMHQPPLYSMGAGAPMPYQYNMYSGAGMPSAPYQVMPTATMQPILMQQQPMMQQQAPQAQLTVDFLNSVIEQALLKYTHADQTQKDDCVKGVLHEFLALAIRHGNRAMIQECKERLNAIDAQALAQKVVVEQQQQKQLQIIKAQLDALLKEKEVREAKERAQAEYEAGVQAAIMASRAERKKRLAQQAAAKASSVVAPITGEAQAVSVGAGVATQQTLSAEQLAVVQQALHKTA